MNQPLETREQLSADEKRRLLAEMLQKKARRAQDRPLSLGQERLWLMARLDPEWLPVQHRRRLSTCRSPRLTGTRKRRAAHRGATRGVAGDV